MKNLIFLVICLFIIVKTPAQQVLDENNYFVRLGLMNEYFNRKPALRNNPEEGGEYNQFQRSLSFCNPRVGENGSTQEYYNAINEYLLQNKNIITNNGSNWSFLGPIGFPPTHGNGDELSNGKGWINAIYVVPDNLDIVYAGANCSGLFKTTDGGDSWYPLTDNEPCISGTRGWFFYKIAYF